MSLQLNSMEEIHARRGIIMHNRTNPSSMLCICIIVFVNLTFLRKCRESLEKSVPNSDQGRRRESGEKGDSVLRELWVTALPPRCHPPHVTPNCCKLQLHHHYWKPCPYIANSNTFGIYKVGNTRTAIIDDVQMQSQFDHRK